MRGNFEMSTDSLAKEKTISRLYELLSLQKKVERAMVKAMMRRLKR